MRNKLIGLFLTSTAIFSLIFTACSGVTPKLPLGSKDSDTPVAELSAEDESSSSIQMWDDLPEGEVPEGYIDENGYIYGDVEGYREVDPSELQQGANSNDSSIDGEYTLEYELSYGWRMDGNEKTTFNLGGTMSSDNVSDREIDWYNKHRPYVYAMFFPDLNGERVCQLYLDFATYETDDEVFINLPYDAPNGTFENDNALHYDAEGAIDNGGNLRINFPITVSGVGSNTLELTDGIDGMHYVFKLKSTNK